MYRKSVSKHQNVLEQRINKKEKRTLKMTKSIVVTSPYVEEFGREKASTQEEELKTRNIVEKHMVKF